MVCWLQQEPCLAYSKCSVNVEQRMVYILILREKANQITTWSHMSSRRGLDFSPSQVLQSFLYTLRQFSNLSWAVLFVCVLSWLVVEMLTTSSSLDISWAGWQDTGGFRVLGYSYGLWSRGAAITSAALSSPQGTQNSELASPVIGGHQTLLVLAKEIWAQKRVPLPGSTMRCQDKDLSGSHFPPKGWRRHVVVEPQWAWTPEWLQQADPWCTPSL